MWAMAFTKSRRPLGKAVGLHLINAAIHAAQLTDIGGVPPRPAEEGALSRRTGRFVLR